MKTYELFTSSLGLGKLPWVPAVWASLPPVILYQVLGYLGPAANPAVMLAFVLAGSAVCIRYAPALVRGSGVQPPPYWVADRTTGQGLTMLMIALLAPVNICNSMALGFVLFRLFDILRPWPCRRLRKTLDPGLNLLVEAWLIGLYAGILANGIIVLLPAYF